MNPRLKTSKKWTKFPKEYSDQIEAVFKENFSQFLENAELIIEGRIYSEEIALRVGYQQKNRLAQANFEVSMNYSQDQQDAVTSIHNCVDAAASMMLEYFENEEEADFPHTWTEFPFQGKKLFLKYSTENSSLEEEANRLLGLANETLVLEDDESEDALAIAEIKEELSPPESEVAEDEGEEDEDSSGPRMFGRKPKKKLH